jgi:hypothetical protein
MGWRDCLPTETTKSLESHFPADDAGEHQVVDGLSALRAEGTRAMVLHTMAHQPL